MNDLIENLQVTLILTNQNDAAARDKFALENPPLWLQVCKYPIFIVLFIIIYRIFYAFSPGIISSFLKGLITTPIIFTLIYRAEDKYRLNKNSEKIKAAEKILSYNEKLLDEYSVVPGPYRGTRCVQTLLFYLLNGRADNLKDAINLYEMEKRHVDLTNELKQIKQKNDELLKQIKKTKEAASWAEIAATLSILNK